MAEVVLRPLELSDVDNMMTWVNDPEVTKNLAGFTGRITREQEQAYLEKLLDSQTDKVYAIESPEGDYMGNVGLHQIYWPARNGRFGIVLRKQYQGGGNAQAALQKMIEVAFDELNMHKVWGIVWEENPKTQHIFKKLRFKKEGVLRDEYFHKGVYHNMVRFSMLEDEYRGKDQ